ncbi:hypothetical protein JB92DRAFT_2857718 [Gautieria morchelliformis]|nr:hypothetical protein JB92DRAFT_2857718 [Gautieria morchelliformis]
MAPRAPPVNIESGFFYFKCPRTQGDLETFWARLWAYKKASIIAPLHPGHVLTVTNYMGSYHGNPSSGTRELPPLIRQCTGYNVTMPLLVLQAPIQGGDAKWSQVWRGVMTSQDFPDLSPVPVIIKLFQESYLGFGPEIGDLWGNSEYAEWLPGARLAANEAWAYDRMRALQGRTVPWSYGFCKCLLPNGEATFGHVMEVIEGPTASTTTADELGLDEVGIFNLGDALATALHEIHECGVLHNDVKEDNVIIHHNSSNQDCNVVLLDFALCTTLGPPPEQMEVVFQDMLRITRVFSALGIKPRTRDWFRSRLQMNVPFSQELAELDQAGWLAPRKPPSTKFVANWENL